MNKQLSSDLKINPYSVKRTKKPLQAVEKELKKASLFIKKR